MKKVSLYPKSLLGQILILNFLAMVLAQILSSLLWYTQIKQSQSDNLILATENITYSIVDSVNYISKLPSGYRELALDQLRSFGGAKYFFSINQHRIEMNVLPPTKNKKVVNTIIRDELLSNINNIGQYSIDFVTPSELRLFEQKMKLTDLPRGWELSALSNHLKKTLPIIVIQLELTDGTWLYLATLLPEPFSDPERPILTLQYTSPIILTSLFLIIFLAFIIRHHNTALKNLVAATEKLSLDNSDPPIPEKGPKEIIALSKAFNSMKARITRYVFERNQMFRSISHDLRTPITRIRLRAEFIEQEDLKSKIESDLKELDILIKSALQYIQDNAIHENSEAIDLNILLNELTEPFRLNSLITLSGKIPNCFYGKPLAIKRCIGNLVDNAIKFGKKAHIEAFESNNFFHIKISDEGKGIPNEYLLKVFEQNFRLDKSYQGFGLGLTTSMQIAKEHHGQITLTNKRNSSGLIVTLLLPKSAQLQQIQYK